MTISIALLVLRIVVGALLIGHGTQKLFGWFGGRGLQATGAGFERMGFQPGFHWAMLASLGEAGGGLLLLLGLLNPIGALGIIGAMVMAIAKVHWSKGPWNTNGGYELPLTYLVVAAVIGLVGPGVYSLDALLRISLPSTLIFWAGLLAVVIVDWIGINRSNQSHSHTVA